MRLKNKLAIITAAASGMGKAGVELFVREGAKVAAIDINESALAALKAEFGDAVVTVKGDLSTPDGCKAAMADAVAKLGGLDILWAHAGIPGPAEVENVNIDEYNLAMALNVTSALVCAGEAAPAMRQRGGGSIVFTASVSGLVGSMLSPIYSAAKFGVVGLTKSLALRYAPEKIRVNVVCPGLTETPMLGLFLNRGGKPEELAENQKKFAAAIPMGRTAQAHEIAHGALWLASDDSSYVTGISLPIDGGFIAR
jgi:NAD(P)-dependent dehydrogenase (short-subunit alcohol dehydrogenase family)